MILARGAVSQGGLLKIYSAKAQRSRINHIPDWFDSTRRLALVISPKQHAKAAVAPSRIHLQLIGAIGMIRLWLREAPNGSVAKIGAQRLRSHWIRADRFITNEVNLANRKTQLTAADSGDAKDCADLINNENGTIAWWCISATSRLNPNPSQQGWNVGKAVNSDIAGLVTTSSLMDFIRRFSQRSMLRSHQPKKLVKFSFHVKPNSH